MLRTQAACLQAARSVVSLIWRAGAAELVLDGFQHWVLDDFQKAMKVVLSANLAALGERDEARNSRSANARGTVNAAPFVQAEREGTWLKCKGVPVLGRAQQCQCYPARHCCARPPLLMEGWQHTQL